MCNKEINEGEDWYHTSFFSFSWSHQINISWSSSNIFLNHVLYNRSSRERPNLLLLLCFHFFLSFKNIITPQQKNPIFPTLEILSQKTQFKYFPFNLKKRRKEKKMYLSTYTMQCACMHTYIYIYICSCCSCCIF